MKNLKYFIIPLMICGLIVTGCGKNTQNGDKTTKKAQVEMKVEEKDSLLYINGNKIDIYKIVKPYIDSTFTDLEYINKDKFYSEMLSDYEYNVIDDILVVTLYGSSKWKYQFFVDSTGNLIKTIDELLSLNMEQYSFVGISNKTLEYKVYYTTLNYVESQRDSDYCNKLVSKQLDDELYHIDTLTYLGNRVFKYTNNVKSVSFKDDDESYEPCGISTYGSGILSRILINKYPNAIFVNNSYDYIAALSNGELLLLNYNGDILKNFGNNYDLQRLWAKLENDDNNEPIIEISGYNYSTNESIVIRYNVNSDSILTD